MYSDPHNYYQTPVPPVRRSRKRYWPWIFGGCLATMICLACFSIVALSGAVIAGQQILAGIGATQTAVAFVPSPTPTLFPTPAAPTPTEIAGPTIPATTEATTPEADPTLIPTPTETPKPDDVFLLSPPESIEQRPYQENSFLYLNNLLESDYPVRDYYESATRLTTLELGERTITAGPYSLGAIQTFMTEDGRLEAELMAVTEHAYFWIETSLTLDPATVNAAAERFELEYYPTITTFFGEVWQPGVDNDPHFSVLHLDGFAEGGELGFFDSDDEYPRTIRSESNQQEIVYLNMDNLRVGEDLYFGTLVHELQHLIQWHNDGNETVWLNEGLSQLTELYVGLDTVDTVVDYLANPGIQLNTWEYDDDDIVFAHYGGAYLFNVYLWEQLGDEAVRDLARLPQNGMGAVHTILRNYRPELAVDTFFTDWAVANYLDHYSDQSPYQYDTLRLGRPSHVIELKEGPFDTVQEMNQYSVDYVELNMSGERTISFAGNTRLALTEVPPHSGEQMWFVPAVDDTNARLTGAFDLTGLTQATLSFWAWYDLEEDFDFAYVNISTDNGQNWRLLVPDHTTPGEYGPSFNGRSQDERDNEGGWVPETISLNSYVGQEILIRFEVMTDPAVTGQGFAIDDISIPELGYATDVELSHDGWQPEGFVQSGWLLPQLWQVRLIQFGSPPQVIPLTLNEQNQGQWTVNLGAEGGVIAITATTPLTEQATAYWLVIE
jgi:hypothetical protein